MSISSQDHQPDDIPWTEEALRRVENAPAFVRPGIRKLVPQRARVLRQPIITSKFLTQIRNESMLRVTKSIKHFGFEELTTDAFAVARRKMQRHPPETGRPRTDRGFPGFASWRFYRLLPPIMKQINGSVGQEFLSENGGTFQIPVDSLLTHTQRYTRFRQPNCSLLLHLFERCPLFFLFSSMG